MVGGGLWGLCKRALARGGLHRLYSLGLDDVKRDDILLDECTKKANRARRRMK